jgi:hypothetical protein
MDYGNEPWIKVYTRDTGGWSSLTWQARGLSLEISRKLDARGELSLGARGLPALAGLLRASWSEIEPFVRELIGDGRLVVDGAMLRDPGHVERQLARTSDALRKKMQRDREAVSQHVTRRHSTSHDVTNRSEEKRSDQKRKEIPPVPSAQVPLGGTDSLGAKVKVLRGTRLPDGWTPSDETQAWARANGVADPCGRLLDEFRDFWAGVPGTRGVKLNWDATFRNRVRQVAEAKPRGRADTRQPLRDVANATWLKAGGDL